jgi:predicted TIM-barrel fold metal-dependent hydrolase
VRIDAHQHFWRLAERGGARPPPALSAIHRDFGPRDLTPLLQASGIDGTVLVQSLPSLAELPQLHCKVSGLLTEAGGNTWLEGLLPWFQALWTSFGPSRLLWGSDWPVLRLARDDARPARGRAPAGHRLRARRHPRRQCRHPLPALSPRPC